MTHKVWMQPLSCTISRKLRWALALSLALGLLWGAGAQAFRTATAQRTDNEQLQLGKPVERELAGGQAHSYQITLAANQYLHVVVEQRGIDVVVALFGSDDQKLAEIDSPNGTQGPEPVSWIAQTASSYRLEVRSLEKDAAAGRYEVRIDELRAATSQDNSRLAGQRAYAEAKRLEAQETEESLRQAIEKYKEALSHFHLIADVVSAAETLDAIGSVYGTLNENQQALDSHRRAFSILETLGARNDFPNSRKIAASIIGNIGFIHAKNQEYPEALEYYNRALPLVRSSNDRRAEATTLFSIGFLNRLLGENQPALEYYNAALPLFRALGDRGLEATTLNNISGIYKRLGENQRALDCALQLLQFQQATQNASGAATTHNNIGAIYSVLGEKQRALDYYQQALEFARTRKESQFEAAVLRNIGQVYFALGENQKGLECYSQVLKLEQATLALLKKAQIRYAETFESIASAHALLGQQQEALDYFQQAIPLARSLGTREVEASAQQGLGKVYETSGKQQEALQHFSEALALSQTMGDRDGEIANLYHLTRAKFRAGKLPEALTHAEAALKIIESVRAKVVSQALRTSFFARQQDFYELYVSLLMHLYNQTLSQGYKIAALQVCERARARSLLELLAEAQADFRQDAAPDLLLRERNLQQRLNAKAEIVLRLKGNQRTAGQAVAFEKEIDALTAEFQQVQVELRQKSPRYAALTQPQPLTAAEIQQQVLDADTLLLEYSLGTERSFLWAVTPTAVNSYELPKRELIEAAAQRVYDLLAAPNRSVRGETEKQRSLRQVRANEQYAAAAAELSRMLLAPVAGQLGKKRLAIVADGMLHYLPFGALPIPKDEGGGAKDEKEKKDLSPQPSAFIPLIVEHEVVNLPSASTLAVLRRELKERKPAPKTLAVLADPVFAKDDPRIKSRTRPAEPPATQTIASLQNERITRKLAQTAGGDSAELRIARLPFTRQEAEQILALVPASERMQALDFAANRATATSEQLSQYRYVHFATHGLADSERTELSTILLSLFDEQGAPQEGFLRAHEVYNMNLPAELVVLSACETGLGKQVKGEGLVSLTRGFMYAGAARVVVSLWSVNDKATAELMTKFYRKVLVEGERPAAALRAAQIEMWRTQQWTAPYYWAAFTLQGEWR